MAVVMESRCTECRFPPSSFSPSSSSSFRISLFVLLLIVFAYQVQTASSCPRALEMLTPFSSSNLSLSPPLPPNSPPRHSFSFDYEMAGRDWPGICTDPSCRFQTPVNIDVREVVDAPQLGDLLSRAHYPVLKGNLSLFHDNGTFFFSLPQTHSYVKVPMFKMKKPFDPQSSSTWDPNNYGPGGSATTSKDDEDDVNDSDSDEDDEDGSDGEADGYGGEDQGDGDGDGEDESGSSSTRKSKSGTKWLKLKLVECHVHSLSETSVDSKQADLEMHCVHQRSGSRVPVFAVLGILMNRDESEICSPFLDKIVAALPDLLQRSVRDSMSVDVGPSFSLRAFLPLDGRYFHFYPGSLTTPPCEEGLLWYIFKQPLPICRRHLDRIRDFIHSLNGERIDNYRVVQPLNGRVIYSWTPWGENDDLERFARRAHKGKVVQIRNRKRQRAPWREVQRGGQS